jgi:hypothetical protein
VTGYRNDLSQLLTDLTAGLPDGHPDRARAAAFLARTPR